MAQLEKINEGIRYVNYEYSCAMLTVDSNTKNQIMQYIRSNIDRDDVYYGDENTYGEFGIERDSHITIVYGYLTCNVDKISDSFREYNKSTVEFSLGKINYFDHKQYFVIHVEVISKDLNNLHNMALNSGMDIINTYPVYTPHITLAYMLPNKFRKYQYLFGDTYFEGMKCSSNKLKITTTDGQVCRYTFS